jgi:hypothetical protein
VSLHISLYTVTYNSKFEIIYKKLSCYKIISRVGAIWKLRQCAKRWCKSSSVKIEQLTLFSVKRTVNRYELKDCAFEQKLKLVIIQGLAKKINTRKI